MIRFLVATLFLIGAVLSAALIIMGAGFKTASTLDMYPSGVQMMAAAFIFFVLGAILFYFLAFRYWQKHEKDFNFSY